MATLEKIRSKQVFLFVVIIGALLAFILGDFFTSGRSFFGNPTTIAKAGDIKIDYNEYQKAVNEASQAQQAQGAQADPNAGAQGNPNAGQQGGQQAQPEDVEFEEVK